MQQFSTLHDELNYLSNLETAVDQLPGYQTIDTDPHQIATIRRHRSNPIIHEAVKGIRSVEENYDLLAESNEGVRKILPRRKDEAKNERLDHLSEIIHVGHQHYTKGIFALDNLVTSIGYAVAGVMGLTYIAGNPKPDEIDTWLAYSTAFSVPPALLLSAVAMLFRSGPSTRDHAIYIDSKIEEFSEHINS